jgi:hypothetical protein
LLSHAMPLPTCRSHYPGGSRGCACRLLPHACSGGSHPDNCRLFRAGRRHGRVAAPDCSEAACISIRVHPPARYGGIISIAATSTGSFGQARLTTHCTSPGRRICPVPCKHVWATDKKTRSVSNHRAGKLVLVGSAP